MPAMMWALLLLFIGAAGVDAARSRADDRDTPAKIFVTSCMANNDPKLKLESSKKMATYVETVTVSDARPNRRIFLASSEFLATEETAYEHSFSSGCGNVAHTGLGVVTDTVTGLYEVTTGSKMMKRADVTGTAEFKVGVEECGSKNYQAFDWISSNNCLKTTVFNPCSSCNGIFQYEEMYWTGQARVFPLGKSLDYIETIIDYRGVKWDYEYDYGLDDLGEDRSSDDLKVIVSPECTPSSTFAMFLKDEALSPRNRQDTPLSRWGDLRADKQVPITCSTTLDSKYYDYEYSLTEYGEYADEHDYYEAEFTYEWPCTWKGDEYGKKMFPGNPHDYAQFADYNEFIFAYPGDYCYGGQMKNFTTAKKLRPPYGSGV